MWLTAALLNICSFQKILLGNFELSFKISSGLFVTTSTLSNEPSLTSPLLQFYYFRYILSLLAAPHWPFWKWGYVFTQLLLTSTMHKEMRHIGLKSECYSMFGDIQQLSPCTHSAHWVPNCPPTNDGETQSHRQTHSWPRCTLGLQPIQAHFSSWGCI